jgi:hypothetical protein
MTFSLLGSDVSVEAGLDEQRRTRRRRSAVVDVIVAEPDCLTKRELQHLLRPGRERRRTGRRRAGRPDRLSHFVPRLLDGDLERGESPRGDPLLDPEQPEQDVLGDR